MINARECHVTITTDAYVPPAPFSMTWGDRLVIALFIIYCILVNPLALVWALSVVVILLAAK